MLEGELRFKIGDQISLAPQGSFVFVPRGTPNCFQNIGSDPARILVLFTPAGMDVFFDRFAALREGDSIPDAFRRIGVEVGMNVVGPPLAISDPV